MSTLKLVVKTRTARIARTEISRKTVKVIMNNAETLSYQNENTQTQICTYKNNV